MVEIETQQQQHYKSQHKPMSFMLGLMINGAVMEE